MRITFIRHNDDDPIRSKFEPGDVLTIEGAAPEGGIMCSTKRINPATGFMETIEDVAWPEETNLEKVRRGASLQFEREEEE